ncbi:MAG: hypothetical protein K0R25_1119 [Rickettsiaceae bacterium]|jgi:TPR repeat protein|nr:hypothetical protein [Rickettsiaceae bacterium]
MKNILLRNSRDEKRERLLKNNQAQEQELRQQTTYQTYERDLEEASRFLTSNTEQRLEILRKLILETLPFALSLDQNFDKFGNPVLKDEESTLAAILRSNIGKLKSEKEEEFKELFNDLKIWADSRNHPACKEFSYIMGWLYGNSILEHKDKFKAVEHYYKRSAKMGYIPAKSALGRYYFDLEDVKKGIKLLEEASNQGDIDAKYRLGAIPNNYLGLQRGFSQDKINKSSEQKLKLLEEAAAQDHASALCALGQKFEMGIDGVLEANPERTVELYKQAAIQRHVQATLNLSYCLEHGIGTKKDLTESANLTFRYSTRSPKERIIKQNLPIIVKIIALRLGDLYEQNKELIDETLRQFLHKKFIPDPNDAKMMREFADNLQNAVTENVPTPKEEQQNIAFARRIASQKIVVEISHEEIFYDSNKEIIDAAEKSFRKGYNEKIRKLEEEAQMLSQKFQSEIINSFAARIVEALGRKYEQRSPDEIDGEETKEEVPPQTISHPSGATLKPQTSEEKWAEAQGR